MQVTRTNINAWMSSNFGRIPPLTSELAALERLKKTINLVSTIAPSFLSDLLHSCRYRGDNHNISDEFEIRQDSTTDCGVSDLRVFEKLPIDL